MTSRFGRPAVRREEIVDHLRQRIITGRLKPQDRLPTRRQLQARFRASLATVQEALQQLTDDGFVEPRGKAGTFVTAQPPHTRRYAVVIPSQPHVPGFPRFWTALMHEAARLEQALPGCRINVCPGASTNHGNPALDTLIQDVRRHRIAGILFAAPLDLFAGTPIVDQPGIPRVAITSARALPPGTTTLRLDGESFVKQAIEHLRAQGRRKISLILPPASGVDLHSMYRQALTRCGLKYHSHLAQESHLRSPTAARHLAQLLMRLPGHDRPDGLVIADDNLVEQATGGLVDAGVRVPTDMDVVAHCNFPWPTPSVVPVRRLGYDAREVLLAAVGHIDRCRQHKQAATSLRIPARFEDEIPATSQEVST